MIESSPWITPLLLIPGVAMLILSTAVRFNRLHDELHEADHPMQHDETLVYRARRFRSALVCLYLAISLLGLAALSGVAGIVGLGDWSSVSFGMTGVSVIVVVYASWELIREATRSLQVVEDHLAEGAER